MSSVFSKIFNPQKSNSDSGGQNQNQQQQNQQQQQQQNNNQNQQQNNNQEHLDINDPNHPNNKKPVNPLAAFEKLFDNPDTTNAPKTPTFKLDPTVVKTYADSLDFSKSITPEILGKLKAGDDSGYADLANALGRQIATSSLESHTALTERFVDARSKFDRTGLDQSINSRLSKNSLESIAAKNPIAKKHMETIAEELLKHNPDASPEWIKEMTPKYFLEMARLTNPDAFSNESKDGGDKSKQKEPTDWNEWLK